MPTPPILDPQMAKQWFADGDESDRSADRAMVNQLRTDVGPRLGALKELASGTDKTRAVNELHKLRGAISSFGFSASSEHLKQLELGWDKIAPQARLATLEAAETTFHAGMKELVRHYPHLG